MVEIEKLLFWERGRLRATVRARYLQVAILSVELLHLLQNLAVLTTRLKREKPKAARAIRSAVCDGPKNHSQAISQNGSYTSLNWRDTRASHYAGVRVVKKVLFCDGDDHRERSSLILQLRLLCHESAPDAHCPLAALDLQHGYHCDGRC